VADHDGVGCDPADPPADATIVLRDLHVEYHVGGRSRPRLRDVFSGRQPEGQQNGRVIKAVRGIDLVARRGESVGLIGRNGSGKSTTLQATAGLLPISGGDVLATSQPVMLGVGAALESNLTGRRNIELGLLALGLSQDEAEERVDDIADFADLDEFIDLPLKTYSSGMRARLHFSIATAIKPEILLVDEALAVGDESFRKKSNQRIDELLEEAGTVFVVSHSLGTLADMCSRVVWIDKGRVVEDGDPEQVIEAYREAS
jgi:teichoic acid transport system ATP-binding protein